MPSQTNQSTPIKDIDIPLTQSDYDVAIIGAGPCGLFAALKLVELRKDLKIVILEAGHELDARDPQDSATGFSGAGGFSDGKLNNSLAVGGDFDEFDPSSLKAFLDEADAKYVSFGAKKEIYDPNKEQIAAVQRQAAKTGMMFLSFPIRHVGTDSLKGVYNNIKETLLSNNVTILCDRAAIEILPLNSQSKGFAITTNTNLIVTASKVIACPGRFGSGWLSDQAQKLGLDVVNNGVDIGVRVEVPNYICESLTGAFYETKFIKISSSDDRVRTFCMCKEGFVSTETYSDGLMTVNGHSYTDKKSDNTNFAILSTHRFTSPFKDPMTYGSYIAALANLLNKGVIVQRFGDLKQGRRSTPDRIRHSHVIPTLGEASPGDLSLVFPYRILKNIIEMVESLEGVFPGISNSGTLLYGVEVKFYSTKIAHDQNCQTPLSGLYVGGDGAGITRGLLQASAFGLLIGAAVAKELF